MATTKTKAQRALERERKRLARIRAKHFVPEERARLRRKVESLKAQLKVDIAKAKADSEQAIRSKRAAAGGSSTTKRTAPTKRRAAPRTASKKRKRSSSSGNSGRAFALRMARARAAARRRRGR